MFRWLLLAHSITDGKCTDEQGALLEIGGVETSPPCAFFWLLLACNRRKMLPFACDRRRVHPLARWLPFTRNCRNLPLVPFLFAAGVLTDEKLCVRPLWLLLACVYITDGKYPLLLVGCCWRVTVVFFFFFPPCIVAVFLPGTLPKLDLDQAFDSKEVCAAHQSSSSSSSYSLSFLASWWCPTVVVGVAIIFDFRLPVFDFRFSIFDFSMYVL